jgi:hypothetical protein
MWRILAALGLTAALAAFALNVPSPVHAEFNGCTAGFCSAPVASGGGGGSCNPPLLSCVTDPTGLVFWMPLDTSTTSGTTTNDLSGNARNGTLTGSPSLVSGKIQQGVSLNGTSQYVTITNASPWSAYTVAPIQNTPFSVTAWVYRTGDNGNQMTFISRGYGSGVTPWQLVLNTSTLTASFNSYNGVTAPGVTSTATSTLNTWEFWVASWDGVSTFSITKNAGTAVTATSTAGPSVLSSEPLDIGAIDVTGTPSYFFPGIIDDPRIYSHVLSGTEITNIYNSGVSGNP